MTRQATLCRGYHLCVVVWSSPGGGEQAEPWGAEHLCDICCVCGQQCRPTGWRCLLFGTGISCVSALPCPALPKPTAYPVSAPAQQFVGICAAALGISCGTAQRYRMLARTTALLLTPACSS